MGCCCTMPFIICIMLFPLSVVYITMWASSGIATDPYSIAGYSAGEFTFYFIIGIITIILIVVCYCYCCSYSGAKRSADMWRDNIIKKINDQMTDWQSQWPQFSMTLIYPLFTTRRGNKGRQRVVDIRGIVRVSKGAAQFVNMPIQNVPIYQQQYVQQPVHSEMVALNMQQPQVMIQNANGQQMMVQGQKAIVNGREVLLVQQPLQQHQQHHHVAPAMSDHSSVNSAIPLSTEQGMYHNNVSLADEAPPAYNPNMNVQQQNDQEQNEGNGATFN